MSEVLFMRNFVALCKANAIMDSAQEQNVCHLPKTVMCCHQQLEPAVSAADGAPAERCTHSQKTSSSTTQQSKAEGYHNLYNL